MSHFSVLVIRTKDSNELEEDMSRYDENLEVEPYIYKTKEELIEAGKARVDADQNQDEYKDLKTLSKEDWISKHDHYPLGDYYNYWKGKATIIDKHLAGTATDDDYHDYVISPTDQVDEDGNLLTTYNPDSKWDWYSEGGRWGGELAIKESSQDEYDGAERVDRAYAGDIDWAKMNSIEPEQLERYKRFWKYYVEEEPYPGTPEERKEEFRFIMGSPEYFKNRYKTVEGYIKSRSTWYTFAVVDAEGNWHEPGTMGWFGCSSASDEEERDWEREFTERFIDPLPDDAELIVLDCHI